MKICCCGWFNKEADWPIAEQDKVRQESQIENARKEKGRVRSLQPDIEGTGDECAMLIMVPPYSRA